jgi:hypothetical protein
MNRERASKRTSEQKKIDRMWRMALNFRDESKTDSLLQNSDFFSSAVLLNIDFLELSLVNWM